MTDPNSPAAVARADEARHAILDAELDEPRATPCSSDRHDRCDGYAWIPGPDVEVPCLCDCGHPWGREAS